MDLFEFAEQAREANSESDDKKETQAVEDQLDQVLTVGSLTAEIKSVLRKKFGSSSLWIKGELSNYRGRNQSGHMYFRLKDERAVLNCVYFRNANKNLKIELKEGTEVLARGRLDLWEKGGNYQLIVEEIRPGGVGELYLRFEQLKKKLEAEGLFEASRKKEIPSSPQRVGIVTSATGAVIRDIIHVTRTRCNSMKLLLHPVRVQGEGSAEEIAAAIAELNDEKYDLDVLIIGRGGGSIEDLWAFNEEVVARTMSGSRLPIISAVGHQTDFTIADFVADQRAATPSQAAELAIPDFRSIESRIDLVMKNMLRELVTARKFASEKLQTLKKSSVLRDPRNLLRMREQRLDMATERMMHRLRARKDVYLDRCRRSEEVLRIKLGGLLLPRRLRFEKMASNLSLLNPLGILARGYSVVSNPKGKVIKRSEDVKKGDKVHIRLHEGRLECQVDAKSKNI